MARLVLNIDGKSKEEIDAFMIKLMDELSEEKADIICTNYEDSKDELTDFEWDRLKDEVVIQLEEDFDYDMIIVIEDLIDNLMCDDRSLEILSNYITRVTDEDI